MTSKKKPVKASKKTTTPTKHRKMDEYEFEDRFSIEPKAGSYQMTLPKKLLYLLGSNELRDSIANSKPLHIRMRTRLTDQGETWTLNIGTTDAEE